MNIVKVYYPLEEAVKKAALQNCRRDYRVGCCDSPELDQLDEEERDIMIEEAQYLLEETGENYYPEHPEYEHICVQRQ